jgi:hypothetical protein
MVRTGLSDAVSGSVSTLSTRVLGMGLSTGFSPVGLTRGANRGDTGDMSTRRTSLAASVAIIIR